MIDLIRIGAIGFIGSKTLKAFGKKELGEVIIGVTVLYLGVHIFISLNGWMADLGLVDKITNTVSTTGEWTSTPWGWLKDVIRQLF